MQAAEISAYNELQGRLEKSALTINHLKLIVVAGMNICMEFFDNFIIGFVMAFIIVPWKLTYGQTSIVLLSAGVGSVLGAWCWGRWADRYGRRIVLMACLVQFNLSTCLMALTPTGNWEFLTVLRLLVGFGVGGFIVICMPAVQEFIPPRLRGRISGITSSAVSIGIILASVVATFLTPLTGWRGLFLVSLIPMILIFLFNSWVPESPRWLVNRGLYRQAANSIRYVLKERPSFHASEDKEERRRAAALKQEERKGSFFEVFRYPRSAVTVGIIYFGVQVYAASITLWGVALLVMTLRIPPIKAAGMFFFVTLGGFAGRFLFAYLMDAVGRRWAGIVAGAGTALFCVLGAITYRTFIGTISVLWMVMIVIFFFADGGAGAMVSYVGEVWPKHLRATGMGWAGSAGNLGRIVGPIGLAVIAGSSNLVSPRTTQQAIVPYFYFLAAFGIIVAIAYYFGHETNKKSIEEIDAMLMGKRS
jgi:putative MFS transporter